MRGARLDVVAAAQLAPHLVHQLVEDDRAVRHPEREARSLRDDAEQVELYAHPAVIALLRLLEPLHVRLERVLVEERGRVDALELLALGVAAPVRAGDRQDLERAEPPSRGQVRPAAQVHELALLVEGDDRLRRERRDQLLLELRLGAVAADGRQRVVPAGRLGADDRQVLPPDRLHVLLDLRQVLRHELPGQVEVVVEAVLDHRADRELHLVDPEMPCDRLRHDVRGRVPQHLERLRAAGQHGLDGGVAVQGVREIDDLGGGRGLVRGRVRGLVRARVLARARAHAHDPRRDGLLGLRQLGQDRARRRARGSLDDAVSGKGQADHGAGPRHAARRGRPAGRRARRPRSGAAIEPWRIRRGAGRREDRGGRERRPSAAYQAGLTSAPSRPSSSPGSRARTRSGTTRRRRTCGPRPSG